MTAYSAQFQALMDDVITITSRQTMIAETEYALRKAIAREHNVDSYPSDLVTAVGVVPTLISDTYYRYAVSITAALPQYRRIDQIREYWATNEPSWFGANGGTEKFTLIDPSHTYDSYGLEQSRTFFVAGDSINIKADKLIVAVNISYYQTPSVLPSALASYSDWLAARFPYVLVSAAAAEIFKMIGKDDESARYTQMLPEIRMDITKSEIGATQ